MLRPGIVASYDREARLCTVEIPGITDGSDTLPIAEICYPIGDKSDDTEIEIIVGDRVWLMFQNDDPRYPVIMGWRPRRSDNIVGTRHWHHNDNVHISADDTIHFESAKLNKRTSQDKIYDESENETKLVSKKIILEADDIEIIGKLTVKGDIDVVAEGDMTGSITTAGDIASQGSITDSDGDGGA